MIKFFPSTSGLITLNICFQGNVGRPGPAGPTGPPGEGIQGPKVNVTILHTVRAVFQALTKFFMIRIHNSQSYFLVHSM